MTYNHVSLHLATMYTGACILQEQFGLPQLHGTCPMTVTVKVDLAQSIYHVKTMMHCPSSTHKNVLTNIWNEGYVHHILFLSDSKK